MIRQHQPFFNEAVLHAEPARIKAMRFWVVHQVLSVSRIDNASISYATRELQARRAGSERSEVK